MNGVTITEAASRARSARSRRRQQRGSNFETVQALRSFRCQHSQFDRGAARFGQRLAATANELIDYANSENERRTSRRPHKRFGPAAAALACRETRAVSQVQAEVEALIRTGRYGHAPTAKPDDTIRLMVENWNSLGVFTGKRKLPRINSLIRSFGVDVIAGSETQCDWRQVDAEERFGEIIAPGVAK